MITARDYKKYSDIEKLSERLICWSCSKKISNETYYRIGVHFYGYATMGSKQEIHFHLKCFEGIAGKKYTFQSLDPDDIPF